MDFNMASFNSENSSKWETVSKKKKATASDKKAARKNFSNIATTVDILSPVKESETVYQAFNKTKPNSNNTHQLPNSSATSSGGDGSPGKKKAGSSSGDGQIGKKTAPAGGQQQTKKKKETAAVTTGKNDKVYSNLVEAFKGLDSKELKAQWTDVQNRCCNAPSLWLGDMVSFLNKKLLTKETDLVFTDQGPNYPLCKMSKHLDFLNSTLKTYSDDMLKAFFDFCIRELSSDAGKGHGAVNGYRVFIQLIASKHPAFVLDYIDSYLTMVKRKQNDKWHCLSIMWSCVQAGYNDPVSGLKVWCGLMLPLLGVKQVSSYAISTLDRILRQKMDKQKAHEILGPNQFFPILDFVFTPATTLPAQLQKQLLKQYSKLKSIAFGAHPEATLRHFFPSLLARTTVNCPALLKNELLTTLVMCLSTDPHCYSKWRQMYDAHLPQSSVLMSYMVTTWETSQKQLPRQLLKETVRAFHLTNEDMATTRSGRSEHEQCKVACRELLERMSGFEFPWWNVLTVVILALATFIAFDVYSHKGFQGSLTVKYIELAGIAAICRHAWSKITLCLGYSLEWASVNIPIYYAKMSTFCGPYLILLQEQLYDLFVYLGKLTAPVWAWLALNIPIALDWVKAQIPLLLDLAWSCLATAWTTLAPYVAAFWGAVSPYLEAMWEAVLHYSVLAWVTALPYLKNTYSWLQETISSPTS